MLNIQKSVDWQKAFCVLRSCGICGSNWGLVDLYCEHCWRHKIFPLVNPCISKTLVMDMQFPVYSLFEWNDSEQGKVVGKLVKDLKGFWGKLAFERLARHFSYRRIGFGVDPGFEIHPSPAKNFGESDHAFWWGYGLSQLWEVPLRTVLKRQGGKSQKQLSAQDRQSLKLDLVTEFSGQESSVIFVDDVITTGATARAAWRALGQPKGFEVWSVACRPLRHLI